jgi:NADH-quinone oxidoreductase subunit E
MFNLAPVGRYYVQLCGTTPCWLRGAEALKDTCRKLIGEPGHVTKDGMFSWVEVECLGACVNAPMVQINKDYYEDLTPESFEKIIAALREGRKVKPGPQDGRHSSEPAGGPTTLIAQGLYAEAPAREPHADEGELALIDDEAKKPGDAASAREAAVPKPPLRDSSGRRRK